MTKIPPLAQLLPHEAPMILIDELISVDVENAGHGSGRPAAGLEEPA